MNAKHIAAELVANINSGVCRTPIEPLHPSEPPELGRRYARNLLRKMDPNYALREAKSWWKDVQVFRLAQVAKTTRAIERQIDWESRSPNRPTWKKEPIRDLVREWVSGHPVECLGILDRAKRGGHISKEEMDSLRVFAEIDKDAAFWLAKRELA